MENHLKTSGESLEYKTKDNLAANMTMSEQCQQTFQELKLRKKHRYIIYKMGQETFEIDIIGDRNETYAEFKRKLPYTDCRFCIFDHEYLTADGRKGSKIYFISWFPNNSTPYHKMAYSTSKTHFHEKLTGVFDILAASTDDLEGILGPPPVEEEEEDFDF